MEIPYPPLNLPLLILDLIMPHAILLLDLLVKKVFCPLIPQSLLFHGFKIVISLESDVFVSLESGFLSESLFVVLAIAFLGETSFFLVFCADSFFEFLVVSLFQPHDLVSPFSCILNLLQQLILLILQHSNPIRQQIRIIFHSIIRHLRIQ